MLSASLLSRSLAVIAHACCCCIATHSSRGSRLSINTAPPTETYQCYPAVHRRAGASSRAESSRRKNKQRGQSSPRHQVESDRHSESNELWRPWEIKSRAASERGRAREEKDRERESMKEARLRLNVNKVMDTAAPTESTESSATRTQRNEI